MFLLRLIYLLALIATPAMAQDYTVNGITVTQPWSRATPPVTPVAVGYLTITNDGSEPDKLISISSSLAERVEIHESMMTDGISRMQPVAEVVIGPGETVTLAPGGLHLMYIKPEHGLKEGERFPATLTFEKAEPIDVEFAVSAMGATSPAEQHEGHGATSQ